jgi:hypothetical protein
MNAKKPFPDPAQARPLMNESDIGSGEKTPADRETEDIIRQIPPLPESKDSDEPDSQSESGFDPRAERERREHDASLMRDEPSEQLGEIDPVPPKGH